MNQSRFTYLPGAALLCGLLTGCSDNAPFFGAVDTEEESHISITLRLPSDGSLAGTRAYPSGGEDGDGREQGLDYENALSDANIFFFKGSGFNPDTADPQNIEVTGVYVDDLSDFTPENDENSFEKKITVKVRTADTDLEERGILAAPEIGFITVINAGRDLSSEISDLKALREYSAFSSTTTKSDTGYSDFLMTTAYDAKSDGNITLGGTSRFVGSNRLEKSKKGNGNPNIEWVGETTVQRLCARIDIMYKEENIGESKLIYLTEGGNKVHITNIHPVNFMQLPSYLLTKATEEIPSVWTETALGSITWGGVEKTAAGSDMPSNYIIEPYTLAKAAGTRNLTQWYGESAAQTVITSLNDSSKGKFDTYFSGSLPASEFNGCDRMTIIGYPDENILAPSCYTSDFITGLAIRAYFQPRKIWKRNGDSYDAVDVKDTDWEALADKTIWCYQPSAGVEGIRENDAYYFTSEADLEAFRADRGYDLATVTKYEDGVCFYNLWLRHYNDESYKEENAAPKESSPMEFAIVRNNIYRVALSFSGPGEPTPTLRQPDTMMSRIFVRKWNQRFEKNPLQF